MKGTRSISDRSVARSHPGCPRTWPARAIAIALAMSTVVLLGGVSGPTTSATSVTPKAYVGLFGDNAIGTLDLGTNRVVRTIPVPTGPEGLIMAPDGMRVYASSQGDSTLSVISTKTDRVVSTLEVGKSPHGLAMTTDGRMLLVAVFGADQVVMIDTIRNQIIARFPVAKPHNIAITPNGRTAYVASQQPDATALVILDLASKQEVGRFPLDKTPRALTFSPDGSALYFTLAGSNAVQVLDPSRNQVVTQIPVGASPHHVLFTPNGEYALVIVQGPGELAIINPASRMVTGTVAVGKFPHWIATTSGLTAYVTNEGGNSVSVVDVEKQTVLATIPVGNAPRKIATQPVPYRTSRLSFRAPTAYAATPALSPRPSPATANGAINVRIANFIFAPATLTVAVGEKITWNNTDSIPHTITSADKRWDSGPLDPAGSFSMTFDKPGTYVYGCTIHPFMQAKIVVGN